MKNFLLSVLLCSIVFTSCKKDRTCDCKIVTDGTNTSRTQTAGIPVLLPGTDTTISQPIYTINNKKTEYKKVSKHDMRRVCFPISEESTNNSSTNVVPGIYTITIVNEGKKTYTCKIN